MVMVLPKELTSASIVTVILSANRLSHLAAARVKASNAGVLLCKEAVGLMMILRADEVDGRRASRVLALVWSPS